MKSRRASITRVLLPLFICCAFLPAYAQQPNPSMLWRLNHPAQAKPSYLYLVTSANRETLFQFPDSLYAALQTTENFSVVRSPKDILTITLSFMLNAGGPQSAMLQEAVSPDVWPTYAPVLQKKFEKPAGEITLWEAIQFANKMKKSVDPSSPFHTDPEMYLFEYARRLNKPINGLQKVVNDKGELYIPLSESELQWITGNAGKGAQKKAIEKMVDAYLAGDLREMRNVCECTQKTDAFHEAELRRVANAIDSQAALKPTLFLVPAGYLLSDKTVFDMLPAGTTLTPVTATQRVSYTQNPLPPDLQPYTPVTDRYRNRYKANMPGEYFEKVIGEKMEMYFGVDMYEETSFFLLSFPAKVDSAQQRSVMEEASRQFMETKKLPEPKAITKNGIPGLEYTITPGQQEKRLQVFYSNEVLLFAMCIRENTAISSRHTDRFFNEVEILPPGK